MQGCKRSSYASVVLRTSLAAIGLTALGATPACNTVERTFTPAPKVSRPVEVVYRFQNVRRMSSVDEWVMIRRILEVHSKGSVAVRYENERRYESAEIRDYEAKALLNDVGDLKDIQEELEALSRQTVGGHKVTFSLMKAEFGYRGESATTQQQDTVLRGVTRAAGNVRLYVNGGESVDVQANQYGAWAKGVKVQPQQQWVYGYYEGGVGAATGKRYFRIDVFSMQEEEITEQQFTARPKN